MAPEEQARRLALEIIHTSAPAGERLVLLCEKLYSLGIGEVPLGSNDGPWVRFFLRGDKGLAWCAAYVLRSMQLVGAPLPSCGYWRGRSVSRWVKASLADGTYMGAAIVPRRGDCVFWRARSGSDAGAGKHVDVITKVTSVGDGLRLTLIGGNVGDRVTRRVIAHRDPRILGFHRVTEHA